MGKLNVLVIFGGTSTEHEVSIVSASTVISNLSEKKYNIMPLYITKEGKWLLYEGPIKDNLNNIQWEKLGTETVLSPARTHKGLMRIVGDKVKTISVDIIFPVLHGAFGEDGTIQGIFEMAGIPYVGCGVLSSAMAMDKQIAKIIAEKEGLEQAKYLHFKKPDLEELPNMLKQVRFKLGYPCFVKPANAGSSVGISKAKNKKELEEAIKEAFIYDDKIVVEKGIIGREVECAVLGSGGNDTEASVVGEIIAAAEFYDYDAKYNNSESKTIIPADISEDIQKEIKEQSLKIFKALGCSGLSRVDFFVENETNKIIFNEINTLPGFTSISMYAMLWKYEGIEFSELLDILIELGLNR